MTQLFLFQNRLRHNSCTQVTMVVTAGCRLYIHLDAWIMNLIWTQLINNSYVVFLKTETLKKLRLLWLVIECGRHLFRLVGNSFCDRYLTAAPFVKLTKI